MFPVFLNLEGRLAVVVGAGPVGRRRMAACLEAGARVRVISLEPGEPGPTVEWLVTPYQPAHLEGAFLVVAAGPAGVNSRVVADARQHGVLVASASDPSAGDFVFPASFRRGAVEVAVGTGGTSPGLARVVAGLLEPHLPEAVVGWAELLAELRPRVKARVADPARRRELLDGLTAPRWLEVLTAEGVAMTRARMVAWLREGGADLEPG